MHNLWLKQPMNEWLPTKWYPGSSPSLPHLCVGKFPRQFGKFGADQWKVWFAESHEEADALRAALAKPVPLRGGMVDFESGPDAAVSKVDTTKNYGDSIVTIYTPPEPNEGWPYITVFRLPSVALAGPLSSELARGVYSFEIDTSFPAALERIVDIQRQVFAAGVRPEVTFTDKRTTS